MGDWTKSLSDSLDGLKEDLKSAEESFKKDLKTLEDKVQRYENLTDAIAEYLEFHPQEGDALRDVHLSLKVIRDGLGVYGCRITKKAEPKPKFKVWDRVKVINIFSGYFGGYGMVKDYFPECGNFGVCLSSGEHVRFHEDELCIAPVEKDKPVELEFKRGDYVVVTNTDSPRFGVFGIVDRVFTGTLSVNFSDRGGGIYYGKDLKKVVEPKFLVGDRVTIREGITEFGKLKGKLGKVVDVTWDNSDQGYLYSVTLRGIKSKFVFIGSQLEMSNYCSEECMDKDKKNKVSSGSKHCTAYDILGLPQHNKPKKKGGKKHG
jgi:hypothetical protein